MIESHLAALEDVRRHDDRRGVRWCVSNRLVARRVDDSTLLIRSDFDDRETLLEQHPETFSVRPELEAHMKVLADVREGDIEAVCAALTAARDLQRRAR
ncbi:hypothetical protein VV02_10110 [Luteipulveratus mongoliensis]|uniref:Uncharacterized protein n=1 Tax=Luteipulveratus mongoliensis TaxID=571913 RepID=A0A0K1JQ15_9MICO|nr:hypothetical protein VV02_10110 [Luteipulveratus mongoliensis]